MRYDERTFKVRNFWRDRRLVTFIPYAWLVVFFLIPFVLIAKISLAKPILAVPPFQDIMQWTENGVLHLQLNIGNYLRLITDSFYASGFLTSVIIALIGTFFCLIIGYIIAYSITKASQQWRPILVLLVVLPFWTSFLIRVYAWMGILSKDGLINQLLQYLGIINEPIALLYNNFAVIIGVAYCYLPFMILPIYSVLDKIDPVYIEAAHDLGCRPWQAFWRIVFPLSMPGVWSGCALVFIPALGEYVIPELLGAPDNLMIGRIIWLEFFNNRDWPVACTVAVVMLLLIVVPIMLAQRRNDEKKENNNA